MSEVYHQLPLAVANKRCSKCGQSLPVSDYSPSRQTKDGLYPQCRACKRGRYWAKRDEVLAKFKADYWADPQKYLAKNRRQRQDHPERYKAYRLKRWQNQQYRDDTARRSTVWKCANPSYRTKYRLVEKRYRDNNRDRINAWIANYRAKKRGNGGTFTGAEWEALKAATDYRCLRCGRTEPEIRLQADHVIPISRGGENRLANIQPLCGSCNTTKNTRSWDFRQ